MLNKIKYTFSISLFFFAVGTLVYNVYQLKFFGNYTTGVVVEIKNGVKGHPLVNYTYTVDGITFTGSSYRDSNFNPHPGEQYKVLYSTLNPSVSRMEP